MPKSFVQRVAENQAKLESQVRGVSSTSRLDYASLEDTVLELFDRYGVSQGSVGKQPDGSYGLVVRVSPPQPTPTAPSVSQIDKYGMVQAGWDGAVVSGRVPEVHGRVDVLSAFSQDGLEPEVSEYQVVSSIWEREGGTTTIVCPQPGVWFVRLQMVGADERTKGAMSDPATVDIEGLVDTDAIEAELDAARERLAEAEAEARQALDEVGQVRDEWAVEYPRLQDEIRAAQEAVAETETRLEAANAGLSDLREVRIPALEDSLADGLSGVYQQAEQRAQELATNALNQATADAQTKFDQAMEVAERALSRAGDNIVVDPSFETNHWRDLWDGLGGRVVRHSGPARTGVQNVIVEGGAVVVLPVPEVNVEVGQSYRFQIWYRTWPSNLADLSGGTRLQILNADNGAVLAESDVFTQGSTYRRAQVMWTVTESVQSIRPVIRVTHPTGLLLMDDMSVQEVGAAAEALRLAELARIDAEAAHLAAGNASDLAASAYDAASSKSTIHWSLTAPTGTGSNGDVWWRYTNLTGSNRRQVMQSWHWDNGVWREDQLSESYLPQVNIGTGTYGDLDGERIRAASIQTKQLAVGNWDNRIKDPNFEQIGLGTNIHWRPASPSAWSRLSLPQALNGFTLGLGSGSRTGSTYSLYYGRPGEGIPVTPGESFQIQFKKWIATPSGETDFRLRVEFIHGDGSTTLSGNRSMAGAVAHTRYREDFTVPDNVVAIRPIWYLGATVSIGIYDVSITRMSDGNLIVQNSIFARHLAVESVSAAVAEFLSLSAQDATVQNLAARIATLIELNASRITTGQLGAARINVESLFTETAFINNLRAAVVTALQLTAERGFIGGALLADNTIDVAKLNVTEQMTAELAQFLVVNAGQIAANAIDGMTIQGGQIIGGSIDIGTPDASGQPGFAVDTQGRMRATGAEINGAFQTRPGGAGGDAITIDRTAWLGGNGERPYLRFDATYNGYTASPGITTNPNEGMIIYGGDPASQIGTGAQITMNPARLTISPGITGQIRFDGALVSSAYAAVATGGTGVRNVGTGGVNMFVNYFVPLPHGQRFVTVSAESTLASQGRIIGTTIQDKDGSGFNVLMRRVDNLDAGTTGTRLNWIAARTNVS